MIVKKVGDWAKASALTNALAITMMSAAKQSLKQVGLYAEGQAKKHMANQDLPWRKNSPRTLADKRRRGASLKILHDSTTYFQSITSWQSGLKAYAGVKRTATYPASEHGKGGSVHNIARTMEFGSVGRHIPARPLWQPVFKETAIYWRKQASPARIAYNKLRGRV